MSIGSEESVSDMLDRVEQQRRQEEVDLLYGDLDPAPEVPQTESEDAIDVRMLDEDEEEEEARHVSQPSTNSSSSLDLTGFGEHFKATLQRFVNEMRPLAGLKDPNAKEKTFSHLAKVKMIDDVKKVSQPIFEELHVALFKDKKIFFKEQEVKTLSFTFSAGHQCPCEMVHMAVLQCPHYANGHVGFCKAATEKEEMRVYQKYMMPRGTQTDRFITATPRTITPSTSSATESIRSRSPSRSSVGSNSSKERAPPTGRGFIRGGGRGRQPQSSNNRRGRDSNNNRRGGSRGNSDNRDRSRSEFSRDNRRRSRSREFKRPSQPAQERLREERRRMEEPANRQRAERAAEIAKKEADKISAALTSTSSAADPGPSRRAKAGESALGPDGQVDYSRAPLVIPPEGMKVVVSVKANKWDVQLMSKDN
jgi:hypothetical protein